jgi:hypothetical protein
MPHFQCRTFGLSVTSPFRERQVMTWLSLISPDWILNAAKARSSSGRIGRTGRGLG